MPHPYKIPLNNKGKYTIVSKEDYQELSKYKWYATDKGHRRTKYARGTLNGKFKHSTGMHRVILGVTGKPHLLVDHINGNGLDNRRENLRIATPSKNASNVSLRRDNTSGYKGVSYRKDRGTWRTEIRKDGKNVYWKTSRCKHLAARKYNDNVTKFHGEYAWTNEVKECGCRYCTEYKRETSGG